MLTPNDKEKFLAELEEVPFPSIACKRVAIAKATIYRWRSEDAAFKKRMDAAIETGREGVTDMAEAHTLMLLKKGDFRAIKLWLENNTNQYYKPKKALAAPPTHRVITTMKLQVVDENGKPMRPDSKFLQPKEEKPPIVVLRRPPSDSSR